jgi:hypothetical protein
LVTEIRAGQAPTPEEVAPRATVFREEESRPLPVMARASEREQKVGKVMAMPAIQDRLEGEAHQKEKTDRITDHMVSHTKKMQDHQETDPIGDVMKDHHQNQAIVHTKEQKEVQETQPKDHIVVVQRDHHQDQEIVHSEEPKDHHRILTKVKYAVRMTDLKGIHKNVLLAELKSPLESQTKDHQGVGQKDHHQNQVIVPSKDQKNHFVTRTINLVAAG